MPTHCHQTLAGGKPFRSRISRQHPQNSQTFQHFPDTGQTADRTLPPKPPVTVSIKPVPGNQTENERPSENIVSDGLTFVFQVQHSNANARAYYSGEDASATKQAVFKHSVSGQPGRGFPTRSAATGNGAKAFRKRRFKAGVTLVAACNFTLTTQHYNTV